MNKGFARFFFFISRPTKLSPETTKEVVSLRSAEGTVQTVEVHSARKKEAAMCTQFSL